MRYFDIPVLRSFLLIAEGKSFAEAASVVGRSASAITQQIKRLEDDIGARVFVRTARAVTLTPDGERLIAHAQRLLLLHDEAMLAFFDAPGRILRLGITQDIAELTMPSLIHAFRQRYPDLSLEVRVDRAEMLVGQIRNQQLDLAIAERREDGANLGVIGSTPMLWLGDAAFSLPKTGRVPIAMLNEPCMFRSTSLEALSTTGLFGDVLYTSPSLQGVFAFCSWRHAVTVRTALALQHSGLVDVGPRLGLPELPRLSYCGYSKNKDHREVKEWLIEQVAETFRPDRRGTAMAKSSLAEIMATLAE
ncbi:LysR substrate-binding domain-containing protein [Robbsia sp. Bb-Pol-6]|uniref:LysR substrate-binding domain-containing protein n=1 Tax=Robbsia betulipollinis TaxID=2981849 RepID=A0ABT3ZMA6_9BURK|nr:LysR substrate-binding domain-containing protein [Robbsia betulipollinis]MCY0387080.1 LysR substrate-binding domain-containing protein [Robbsia betulipollinis]